MCESSLVKIGSETLKKLIPVLATALATIPAYADMFGSIVLKTSDIRPTGFLISEGPVAQVYFDASLTLGKGTLSGFVWGDHNLDDGATHEVDFGITYRQSLTEKLSVGVSVQLWEYPSNLLGDRDFVGTVGVYYQGAADANVVATKVKDNGMSFVLDARKTWNLGKYNATLGASTAYLDDYFGVTGMSNVQVKAGISESFKGLNVKADIGHQHSLNDKMPSKTYVLFSLTHSF